MEDGVAVLESEISDIQPQAQQPCQFETAGHNGNRISLNFTSLTEAGEYLKQFSKIDQTLI